MIYTALVLAAATAVSPLSHLVHLHSKTNPVDERISVRLVNQHPLFVDVMVDGHTYTVRHNGELTIKAPSGTKVYAASPSYAFKRGEVIFEISPSQNLQTINLQ